MRQLKCQNGGGEKGRNRKQALFYPLAGVSALQFRNLGTMQVFRVLDLNSTAIRGIIESRFLKQLGCQRGNAQNSGE